MNRNNMHYLLDFLRIKAFGMQQEFITILKCNWGNYYVDYYKTCKNLNVLHEEKVLYLA